MNALTWLAGLMRKPEQRMAGDPIYAPVATMSGSGGLITARLAENMTTVLACVNVIASTLAGLPARIYRAAGDAGREEVPGHPIARLMRSGPNAFQTWNDFIEWVTASALLRGNGLAELRFDAAGRLSEMRPIPWNNVSVVLLRSGSLAYDVMDTQALYGADPRPRRLLQSEVLHLRDRSDDGLIGRSRLQRAASAVSAAVGLNEFSEAMWRNQATPSGVVESVGKLSKESRDDLKRQITDALTGPGNARKVMVLDSGISWKAIGVSPEDAELLASRSFSVEELARVFGTPPPLVGHLKDSTFTNSETMVRLFASVTLSSWARKLQAEFLRSVFSDSQRSTYEIEWDLSALLRGDPELRWASNKIAVDGGILTPNEIRDQEGYNPMAGGDVLRVAKAVAAPA